MVRISGVGALLCILCFLLFSTNEAACYDVQLAGPYTDYRIPDVQLAETYTDCRSPDVRRLAAATQTNYAMSM